MAGYYIHMPFPTERGGLTAKELLYAQMPCYFGLRDCTTGESLAYLYSCPGDFNKILTSFPKKIRVFFQIAVPCAGMPWTLYRLIAGFHVAIFSTCLVLIIGFDTRTPAVRFVGQHSTTYGGRGSYMYWTRPKIPIIGPRC